MQGDDPFRGKVFKTLLFGKEPSCFLRYTHLVAQNVNSCKPLQCSCCTICFNLETGKLCALAGQIVANGPSNVVQIEYNANFKQFAAWYRMCAYSVHSPARFG